MKDKKIIVLSFLRKFISRKIKHTTFKNRKQNVFKRQKERIYVRPECQVLFTSSFTRSSSKAQPGSSDTKVSSSIDDISVSLRYIPWSHTQKTIKCDQQSIRIDSTRVIIVRPNRACRDIFRLKNQFNNTKQSHTRCVYEILIETIKNLHMISFQLCVSKYSRWISEFLYRDYLQEYSLICMLHWIEYFE